MTRKQFFVAAIAMTALTFSAVLGAGAQGLTAARPTKVATVDVLNVFNGLQEKAQVEADIRTRGEQLRTEEESRRKELMDLQNDLKILAPETQAYTQKTNQIKRKVLELKVWSQMESENLTSESSIQLAGLYRKMCDTIGKVAKENNYDMVIYKEQEPTFQNVKPESMNQIIQMRKVLWSADDMEITDQTITRMNNDYKNMLR